MPRFSEFEKEQIRAKLCIKGEQLFATHGLKKVTIDEIVSAANIAKATFYTFYESKELLYLDIVQNVQLKIFTELENLLSANANLRNKQRVRQIFTTMHSLMLKYPILSGIDNGVVELITRKVGLERLAMFSRQNLDATLILARHGIKFNCSPEIVYNTFQALYHCWISLQSKEKSVRETVSDILLNGVIDKIVIE